MTCRCHDAHLLWDEQRKRYSRCSTDLVVRSSQALCQRIASGHWECIWRQWSGWKDTVVVQIRKVIVVDQRRLPTLLQPRRASMDSSSVVIPTDSSSSAIAPVSAQQPRRKIPKVQFRVLIIGRANAGKTSILQRVCDTTKSPVIYRGKEKEEEVRGPKVMFATLISLPTRLNLSHLWMLVQCTSFSVASEQRTSEESTPSMTNLCSPITRATFFTTPAESSQVA